jgi:hypothetical protein
VTVCGSFFVTGKNAISSGAFQGTRRVAVFCTSSGGSHRVDQPRWRLTRQRHRCKCIVSVVTVISYC